MKFEILEVKEGGIAGIRGTWRVVLGAGEKVYGVTLVSLGARITASAEVSYWLYSRKTMTSRPCSRAVKPGALFDSLRAKAINAVVALRDQETDRLRKEVHLA